MAKTDNLKRIYCSPLSDISMYCVALGALSTQAASEDIGSLSELPSGAVACGATYTGCCPNQVTLSTAGGARHANALLFCMIPDGACAACPIGPAEACEDSTTWSAGLGCQVPECADDSVWTYTETARGQTVGGGCAEFVAEETLGPGSCAASSLPNLHLCWSYRCSAAQVRGALGGRNGRERGQRDRVRCVPAVVSSDEYDSRL